jgi:hypothetical protein
MSLYQCQWCGCCENTALGAQPYPYMKRFFDWTGLEERQDMQLCSACGPTRHRDGSPTEYGRWHDQFERTFLPKGMFETNQRGNLEHVETGSEDFRAFAVKECEPG